jgi:poly-gamma-glutamate synthesis protein (capsule biosynthesis protein)
LDFFGVSIRAGAEIGERRYPDEADLTRAAAAIHAARASAELVVVSAHHHHWEADWTATPRWLQSLAETLVEAGADIVFCHGAPVLQGMTFHKGRPIFYGLGNFIFHTARAERYDSANVDVWRSALAVCDFDAGQLKSVDLHPLRVGPPETASGGAGIRPAPQLLSGASGEAVIDGFLQRSALTGASIERRNGRCTIHAPLAS